MKAQLPSLRARRRTIDYCAFCPKMCRFVCAAFEGERREAVSPTAKMTTLRRLASGALRLTPDNVAPIYHCTGCGRANTQCLHDINPATVLFAAREEFAAAGVAPARFENLRAKFRCDGHHFGASMPVCWPRGLLAAADPRSPFLYYPSCAASARNMPAIRETLILARRLGAPLRLPPTVPPCCGYPLRAAGYGRTPEMAAQSARVAAVLAGRFFGDRDGDGDRDLPGDDVAEIIVDSPGCAGELAEIVAAREARVPSPPPRLSLRPNPFARAPVVRHIAAWLADRRASLAAAAATADPRVPFQAARRVVVHDPCGLARPGPFRRALSAGAEGASGEDGGCGNIRDLLRAAGYVPLDLPHAGVHAACSGGGGGYPLASPSGAAGVAARRVAEAEATGAPWLITSCATCQRQFEKATAATGAALTPLPLAGALLRALPEREGRRECP